MSMNKLSFAAVWFLAGMSFVVALTMIITRYMPEEESLVCAPDSCPAESELSILQADLRGYVEANKGFAESEAIYRAKIAEYAKANTDLADQNDELIAEIKELNAAYEMCE